MNEVYVEVALDLALLISSPLSLFFLLFFFFFCHRSIDFSPTGSLLGSASYDGVARLWTAEGELHGVLVCSQALPPLLLPLPFCFLCLDSYRFVSLLLLLLLV